MNPSQTIPRVIPVHLNESQLPEGLPRLETFPPEVEMAVERVTREGFVTVLPKESADAVSSMNEGWVSALDFRDRVESELNQHRGDVPARVRELKEEVSNLVATVRKKDAEIHDLLARSNQGSVVRENPERLKQISERYQSTIDQYKDLFQTCEQELYQSEQSRLILEKKIREMARAHKEQMEVLSGSTALYHDAEKRVIAAEKKALELTQRLAQREAQIEALSLSPKIAGEGEARIQSLDQIQKSLENLIDFLVKQGVPPVHVRTAQFLTDQFRLEIQGLRDWIQNPTLKKDA
ncbi:MAG: hypothetical protein JNL01_12130 [Bdellovibrionales bacterium]|nr:hypothetical protein [Bdellovibrionales bacterium]